MPRAEMESIATKRRKRILIESSLFVFVSFLCSSGGALLAKQAGYTTITYSTIGVSAVYAVIVTAVVLIAIALMKDIHRRMISAVFFAQYAVWSIFYVWWVFQLNEIRVIALVFGVMMLLSIIAYSNWRQALFVALTLSILHLIVAYTAIELFKQSGSFIFDAFCSLSFLPTFAFVSFMAGKFEEQRNDIHLARVMAEKVKNSLWGEMEIAKKIQTVLLPEKPYIPGYEISAHMFPSDEVGGDYYDFFEINGRYWIAIGDVAGHGVSAGLVMMMIQTSIRMALIQQPDLTPAQLLTILNRVLSERIRLFGEDKYMTITVFSYEANGLFHFSGLHQDILIYRARTGEVEFVESNGLWLGFGEDLMRSTDDYHFILERGDAFILYTDGITEARLKGCSSREIDNIEMFGAERLKQTLRRLGHLSPHEISSGILKELTNFDCHDDVTLIVCKRIE